MNEEFELMRIEYYLPQNSNTPNIVLWGRNVKKELKSLAIKFTPRFNVGIDEPVPSVPYIKSVEGEYKSLDNKLTKQINVNCFPDKSLTSIMTLLRMNFKDTYESHVRLTRRYLVTMGIKSNYEYDGKSIKPVEPTFTVALRTLFLDIETNSPADEWVSIETPTQEITAISFYDNYTNKIIAMVWHPSFKSSSIETTKATVETKFGTHTFEVIIYKHISEPSLITSFVNYIRDTDPDMLVGWYSYGYYDTRMHKWHAGFDMPYIVNRMKLLRLNTNRLSPLNSTYNNKENQVTIKGRVLFDLLTAYKDLQKPVHELPSWTLGYVAKHELGIVSEERKPWAGDLWQKNPIKLLEHNVLDVIKTYLIDKYRKVIEHYDNRRKVVGCCWDDVFLKSRVHYMLALRQAQKDGVVLPDKFTKEIIYSGYVGAYVKKPIIGLHSWVIGIDFRMAYPTIIRAFNISPETVDENGEVTIEAVLYDQLGQEVTKLVKFRQHPRGLLPSVFDYFVQERIRLRKLVRTAKPEERELLYMHDRSFKFVLNSGYGVIGSPFYPLYNPLASASITAVERELMISSEELLKKKGFLTTYADTDNLYVIIPNVSSLEECLSISKELIELVNNHIGNYIKTRWGLTVPEMEVELAEVFKSIFFKPKVEKKKGKEEAAKKRFAGLLVWRDGKKLDEPIVVTKGLETIRSDVSSLSKEVLNTLFSLIFSGERKETLVSYVKQVVEKFSSYPIEYLGIVKGISKPLYLYPKPPAVVRGSTYSNKWFKTNIGRGFKPKYLYVSRIEGYPSTDVISFRDEDLPLLPLDRIKVNYPKMLEVTLRNKVETIFDGLGISWINEGFPLYKPKRRLKAYEAIKAKMKGQRVMESYMGK